MTKTIMYSSTFCDTRDPRNTICSFKMGKDDFVNITYPLGFAIDETIPEMYSRCNSSADICARETGTSEFTIEGTFGGMDIRRIVFSDGLNRATLFVRNESAAEEVNIMNSMSLNITEPAVLKISDYKIDAPTPVILPFPTKTPTATAYDYADKTVPGIFSIFIDSDCKYNYVCITKTGGNSTIHLEGIVTKFPTKFEVTALNTRQKVTFFFNSNKAASRFISTFLTFVIVHLTYFT
ncbi:unnamed protein product [Hymenolepis diminuta]|uniref:Uncharacterized protein n=1 Tax=Hymenolepis diminuta TaxID=6216 RepID=A0A564Y5Y6_HYMDI|nr:unnamed protein product [Hymenolepis diminuta]